MYHSTPSRSRSLAHTGMAQHRLIVRQSSNQSINWLIYQLVDYRLINRGINQLMVHGTPGLLASLSPSLKLGILRWSSKMSLSRLFKKVLSSPPAPLRSQRSHRGWGTPHKGKHRQGSCKQELAGRRWCRCHRRSSTWQCLSPPRRCLGWAGRCGRSEGVSNFLQFLFLVSSTKLPFYKSDL